MMTLLLNMPYNNNTYTSTSAAIKSHNRLVTSKEVTPASLSKCLTSRRPSYMISTTTSIHKSKLQH